MHARDFTDWLVCIFLTKIKLSSTGACRQMCVVKVNRVESNVLGISSKDSSQDSSPTSFPSPSSPTPQPDAPPDGQTLDGSGVADGAPERLGQWPYSPQIHPGHGESEGCITVTSEHPLQELPLEEDKTVSCDSAESKTDPCLFDADPQTLSSSYDEQEEAAEAVESLTRTQNADSSMDMMTELDSGSESNCVGLAATSPEALYRIEPAGGDSCTRCHSPPLSVGGGSPEARGSEENLPPPLLQSNAVDMPLLTPEREDKAGSCPLPPVLTQEMPSLTPAHEGASVVPGATTLSCGEPAAPVLQRETPTGSPSSSSSLLNEGEMDSTTGEAAAVTQGTSQNSVSDSGRQMENTELQNAASEQNQPVQSVEFTSEHPDGPALSEVACHPLSTGTSNGCVPSPAPPSASSTSHCTVHCPSRNPFADPGPLPGSVWKNLSSVNSAVLTQSLNPPELHPDFTHDPLPYAMWAEPRCKEVTDLEGSDMEPRHAGGMAEDGEEEGGTLTWAQLEPTSLISVGAAEPLGLCGDYEPPMGVGVGCEGLSLCRQEIQHLDTAGASPLVMEGGEQDVASDTEEGQERRQLGTRGDNSSESSDDEEEEEEDDEDEENDACSYRCYESRLEPGEICAVSVSAVKTEIQLSFDILYIHLVFLTFIFTLKKIPWYTTNRKSYSNDNIVYIHSLSSPTLWFRSRKR